MTAASSDLTRPVVGVLALQGGFAAHGRLLEGLGVEARFVRVAADFSGLDGLVLPGGESTTMMLGIERDSLADPLAAFVKSGKPVLATCAGAIVADSDHLGLISAHCDRNAYGSQVHSFEAPVSLSGDEGDFPGVFIRAPKFTQLGPSVSIIATIESDEPVGIQDGAVTALAFHPELSTDPRLHQSFIERIRSQRADLDQRPSARPNSKEQAA